MLEIRFHGRGGQGTVIAAKILAETVLRSGRGECMAIPEFGVERRGAPVVAYARISKEPIRLRTRIYEPDAVVLLDPTLLAGVEVTRGLKKGGLFLINAETLEPRKGWEQFKLRAVPAKRIALGNGLGSPSSPIVNTAVCGALCAELDLCEFGALESAIRECVPVKIEANVKAAREAFEHCRNLEGAHAAS